MAVIGAILGKQLGAFGRKPEIPKLPAIDPNQIQQAAISGNANMLPQLDGIAGSINQFNSQQQMGMVAKALELLAPGQLAEVEGITASKLRGEVPADVAAQVRRRGAARALGGGFAGSGLDMSLSLCDLGLGSLDI